MFSQRTHFLKFMDPCRVAVEGNEYSGLYPGQTAGVSAEGQLSPENGRSL